MSAPDRTGDEDEPLSEDDKLENEMSNMELSDDLIGGIMSAVWPFASKHIETEIFGAVERSISGSFNLRLAIHVIITLNKEIEVI